MKQYVFTIILTGALTLALSWVVWQLSLRYKLYPGIRERDVHSTPTPRLGGVAIFIAFVLVALASSAHPNFRVIWEEPAGILSILGASALIVVVGALDDIFDLDWMIKLAAQFVAAGIITIVGGLQIHSLPIGGLTVGSSWASIALTIFAIVVVMNAVNFIDGLDGLVAGVCLIAGSVFFVYSYLVSRDTGANSYFTIASFLSAVIVGACVGFLPLNWRPAKLFMGDSGALLLGLLMATSTIAITGQIDPASLNPDTFGRSQLLGAYLPLILIPVIVVIFPLTDFGLAVIRRMGNGRSPFSPDRKHLHHRLLDLGHSHRGTVLVFYAWTAIISLAVLLMYIAVREQWPGRYWVGVIYGVVGAIACTIVTIIPAQPARAARKRRHQEASL